MNFFYLEKNIANAELKKFSGRQKFSELTIQKLSLSSSIQKSLNKEFNFHTIESINHISSAKEEIVVWNSNIFFKEPSLQALFIKKLQKSYFGLFYGSQQSYIFKGTIAELRQIINSGKAFNGSQRIIKLSVEENIVTINTTWNLKEIALHSPHARHFNKLALEQGFIKKESSNKDKIIGEFTFLNNIPKEIQQHYVEVHDLKVEAKKAQYLMKKINGLDLSMQHINQGFSKNSMQDILGELRTYFQSIAGIEGPKSIDTYDFIVLKNEKRLLELQSWEGFAKLNAFIENHTSFLGMSNLFELSNELLRDNKSALNAEKPLISHGDLCFANIIMDEDERKLVFIDPRGGAINESYRTPYYDLAKLCHSLLGGYDHIINNVAEIGLDDDMHANVKFDQNLLEFRGIFKSFVESLGFEYNLVRVVEISLFLSMLPLHVDSTKKINMLALRAGELIEGLGK
jgi:hypothetical protein